MVKRVMHFLVAIPLSKNNTGQSQHLPAQCFAILSSFKFRHPRTPVYWILISKGFKTYLLLANNYYSYYPHYDEKNAHLKDFVESYCKEYFSEYYNKETGLLNFGDDYQPLKADVAPITT